MAIEFQARDFFHPAGLLKTHNSLERTQWLAPQELQDHQEQRLRIVIRQAATHVPYYRDLFARLKLDYRDIQGVKDLKALPILTKEILRTNFKQLMADNAARFAPRLCRTSGTSGEPVEFFHDVSSNSLEFCYYWRYWSWAGYRLGSSFAEFSLHHFLQRGLKVRSEHSPLMNRLMLNPAQLSLQQVVGFVMDLKKYRVRFLKGAPASLSVFASFMAMKGISYDGLKAVFTTGELLLSSQRTQIEKVFGCRILDSYGHMERTVAICQCPHGRYHVNSDYGVLELEKDGHVFFPGTSSGTMIGTSLYSMAMPLIRYQINDFIEVRTDERRCECGRGLPICEKIFGRAQDTIKTLDGRMLTNVFILFDILEGAIWVQIIQEKRDRVVVKIVPGGRYSKDSEDVFLFQLQQLLGRDMFVKIEYLPEHDMAVLLKKKFKPVVVYSSEQ